jgi:hypothetical protein
VRISCDEGGAKRVSVASGGVQKPGLTRACQSETGDDTRKVLTRYAGAIEALARSIKNG